MFRFRREVKDNWALKHLAQSSTAVNISVCISALAVNSHSLFQLLSVDIAEIFSVTFAIAI